MLDYKFYESNVNSNDTIVLLHGLGGNYGIFSKQIATYKKQFNVLAINLPGHGKSPDTDSYDKPFNSDLVVDELLITLDELGIEKAHFVGISLGSVVLHHVLQRAPERVQSTVLGGAITRFTPLATFLLLAGTVIKRFVPYMWLYKLFAIIMMPKANHASSRKVFIREAVKMKRNDFLAWYGMAFTVKKTYAEVQKNSRAIPKLYISGEEDHLFVEPLLEDTKSDKQAQHVIIEHCGHVCNVEKPREFNAASLAFFNDHRLPQTTISSAL